MKRFVLIGMCLLVMASGIYALPLPVASVQISPDTMDSVPVGQTISYSLWVINHGDDPDVIDITFTSNRPSWQHQIRDSVGEPLADTDGDGISDVGALNPWDFASILVDITPPLSAGKGEIETTYVYAHSSVDLAVYDSALLVTKALEPIGVEEKPQARVEPISVGSTIVYDVITISFSSDLANPARVELYDVIGRRVYSETYLGIQVELDVSNLPKGVYFVSVYMDERKNTKKIVIR